MNAAGIDVSSRKSTIAVLRPFGEVVKVPFEVSHTAEGLASLARQLKAIDGETRVVMEHTGRYYESVANVLHESGLYGSAVNPLPIKEYGGNSLRKVKTDKADAMKIARYALDNWCDLRDYISMFREKAEQGKLVIFVGAGVSCNVDGMPSWNALIQNMAKAIDYSRCDTCRHRLESCENTCLLKDDFSTDELLRYRSMCLTRIKNYTIVWIIAIVVFCAFQYSTIAELG